MRTPGMNLGYIEAISAGPSVPPYYLDGAIGTSFFTANQNAWNDGRKKYGSLDDPDAGGYNLNQINWDKDNGTAEMTVLEATNAGWYSPSTSVVCNCDPVMNVGTCRCR